jgi:hypothetical protein
VTWSFGRPICNEMRLWSKPQSKTNRISPEHGFSLNQDWIGTPIVRFTRIIKEWPDGQARNYSQHSSKVAQNVPFSTGR